MFPSTRRFDSPSGAPGRRHRRGATALLALGLTATVLVGCSDDPDPVAVSTGDQAGLASCAPETMPDAVAHDVAANADVDGTTLTLATHDSFATSDGIFDSFTEATGIEVKVVTVGDAGQLVSQSILTAGKPVADVLFGIDTTFLCRGTRAGLFVPYASPTLSDVDDGYEVADDHLATPIDVGDVCLNYSKAAYPNPADAPQGLDDLAEPRFAKQFVTENPESSSPGLAFLLATIAQYGKDGWEDYWTDLRANDVQVTSGWTEAYEDAFGFGSGDRSIVTSYASSLVADVLYADPPRDDANIGVVADACFRQVEFAGILRGTEHADASALLIDFLLSPTFQEDIPLNMFVEPVNDLATVPDVFEANRTVIDHPLSLTPAEIEAGRDAWTARWTEIVLR